jgi:osmoprotectant transport system permease protein
MDLLREVWEWLASESSWLGDGLDPGILVRLYEHTTMSGQAVALAALVVLPIGFYVGHRRRFELTAVSVGNLGQALPSFGILGIAFAITGSWPGTIGFWATFITLFLLAIPPLLTSTYVGVKSIDRDTVESARGMGMTEWQILWRIEVPLAAPLIMSGIRLAAVQVVATATLAALVAWGGLGRYIIDGFQSGNSVELVGGAILVAALAITTELLFGFLQKVVTPRRTSLSSPNGPPAEARGAVPVAPGSL